MYENVYQSLTEGKLITIEERHKYGIDLPLRVVLQHIVKHHNALFHGSREFIEPFQLGIAAKGRPLFAADNADVAILKALFTNRLGNLDYSYNNITRLGLPRLTEGIVGEKGYIYLMINRENFRNRPNTWEWYTELQGPRFGGCLEVSLEDFSDHINIECNGITVTKTELREYFGELPK